MSVMRFAPAASSVPHRIPVRHHSGDCGYDLYVSDYVTIQPDSYADVPHNVRPEMPPHTWGFLVGRSSTFRNKGLIILPGIIDNGYRGELFVMAYNPGPNPVQIQLYDRIAQLILVPMVTPPVELVRDLGDGDRGSDGFGSTDQQRGESHRRMAEDLLRKLEDQLEKQPKSSSETDTSTDQYVLGEEVTESARPKRRRTVDEHYRKTDKAPTLDGDIVRQEARRISSTAPLDTVADSQSDYAKIDWQPGANHHPPIICLCGSTRFWREFIRQSANLTIQGNIVLSVGCDMKGDDEMFAQLTPEQRSTVKHRLDMLHRHKIDMADRVLVLNVDGYIGESTTAEIVYALDHDKPVDFLYPELLTDEQRSRFIHYPARPSYPSQLGGLRFA